MTNVFSDLFGGPENSIAFGLELLRPTRSGSFGESLANAGKLALELKKQTEQEKRLTKLYELQLDKLTRESEEDEGLRTALQQIAETRISDPDSPLSELFFRSSAKSPSLLNTAVDLKNQEDKLILQRQKVDHERMLGQQASQLTNDPLSQLFFQSGDIPQGVAALGRSQKQAQESDQQQQDINTALSILGGAREQAQQPVEPFSSMGTTRKGVEDSQINNIDDLIQQNSFSTYARGIEEAARQNPLSKTLLKEVLSTRKEEARQRDLEQKNKLKEEINKSGISSATEKEIKEIRDFYEYEGAAKYKEDGEQQTDQYFSFLKFKELDTTQQNLLSSLSANRVKALMARGLDKSTALKHVLEWGKFNLLVGKKVEDLINLPVPTAREIEDLEKTDPVVKEKFSERQIKFASKYKYLPGLSIDLESTSEKIPTSVVPATKNVNVDPEDLRILNKVRKSGNPNLIKRAESIFFNTYNYLPE